MELSPLDIYILLHIKRAQVEYAKMIMKMTELSLENIQRSIDNLVNLELIERDSGSAIKRRKARFKRANEVHKHHTYYKLSRDGILFVRHIDRNFLKEYFNSLLGTPGFDFIQLLKNSRNFKEACKNLDLACSNLFETLRNIHFITKNGNKTKFFHLFIKFAEL